MALPVIVSLHPEPPRPMPEPHGIQIEALAALEATRRNGHRAGLVVLATGLGKTWLSAFDSRGFDRVLFVAQAHVPQDAPDRQPPAHGDRS